MKLKLHIDRLLLEGLPEARPHDLGAAIIDELKREFSHPKRLAALHPARALPRVQAQEIAIRKGQTTRQLGAAVARSAARAMENR
jgi:hypothetical protein